MPKPISLILLFLISAVVHGADRPHIVIFLVDDLGSADVGFNGGAEIKTPHIDSIARSGAHLRHFYVMHVCSPTRAALLTGRYPIRYGLQTGVINPVDGYGLPLSERLMPQALKEAGYTTAICGKWHLGIVERSYLPTSRGFDHQYGHYSGALDYFTKDRAGGFDWHRDDKVLREEGYTTELVANECVRLINAQPKDKPLFLYVPFNGVHGPYQVPDKYRAAVPELKNVRQTYGAMLTAVDEAIGKIMGAIDQRGMRPNTLYFFSTDNGGPAPGRVTSNGPLRAGKGTLYEGGVRSCAAMAWEGKIKPGTVVDAPMHLVDLYPTFLKLAGASLEQKTPLDGRDVWPCITEGKPSPHDAILINAEAKRGAIRVGDWKLVVGGNLAAPEMEDPAFKNDRGPAKTELYNLAEDVGEKNDLSAKNPEKVKELRARYDGFAKEAVPSLDLTVKKRLTVPKVWGEME